MPAVVAGEVNLEQLTLQLLSFSRIDNLWMDFKVGQFSSSEIIISLNFFLGLWLNLFLFCFYFNTIS